MAEARQVGAVLDGFELEEKIHQGSMAEIWRVRRADSPTAMVMKIPSFRDGDDPAALVGFEVEQMILPQLSGVHVPRFLAAGDWSVQPYIVMEQIRGQSLRARLDEAPLDPQEVASIGARVAAALHDLHTPARDPSRRQAQNVMFRDSGEAVLIDFGLSRHDRLPDLLAEQFRLPMGTGPYISPEQIAQIRNDPRSDMFSLGVRPLLPDHGRAPLRKPHQRSGPAPSAVPRPDSSARAGTRDCPPWLQEAILRCLEVAPADRYETAAHLGFELQHPEQVP